MKKWRKQKTNDPKEEMEYQSNCWNTEEREKNLAILFNKVSNLRIDKECVDNCKGTTLLI